MSHLDPSVLARFDALPPDERAESLDHLAGCAACRGDWLAADPSRAFALLARVELPASALDRLSERVRRAVDGSERIRRRPGSPGRLLGAASIAASLLLGLLIGGYVYRVPRPAAPSAAGGAAALSAGAGVLPGEAADAAENALPARREPERGVELLESPGTGKLVSLRVGKTRVVMIFDAELDL